MKPWYLYIVLCNDSSLYTGITTNIQRRINEHNTGRGAKYTRGRGPVELVHLRQFSNRSDASKVESAVKKLNRKQKLEIIKKFALPGELVELTGRTTRVTPKYAMVIKIKDYGYSKYIKGGAAIYEMSDGTSGFSYAYRKIETWDFV
jgi:putative endonuclease